MDAPASKTFSPAPDEADRLLTLLTDPHRSLADIAAEAGLTLPALTVWLTTPDVSARIDATESLAARRARLVAADALPAAIGTLTAILRAFLRAVADQPAAPDQASAEHQHRRAETARKAAALLHRLSNFTPGPARPRATTAASAPAPGAPARRLATLNRIFAPDAGDEAPSQPPLPSPPPPPPNPRVLVPTRPSPETVDLSDPATTALLERLATIPEDAPDEEVHRLLTQLLHPPLPIREAG